MTEDQRFAATRPDVLVYRTDVLEEDLTVLGPIGVTLHVSTSGTDSDFVVKVIDVYPGDLPTPEWQGQEPRPANYVRMGGYQQLVRGEPFRGKFRRGFETPVPFTPGQPDLIRFRAARRGAHVPPWPPADGAGAELVVPAHRPEPADVHRHPEGAARGLPARDAARLPLGGAALVDHAGRGAAAVAVNGGGYRRGPPSGAGSRVATNPPAFSMASVRRSREVTTFVSSAAGQKPSAAERVVTVEAGRVGATRREKRQRQLDALFLRPAHPPRNQVSPLRRATTTRRPMRASSTRVSSHVTGTRRRNSISAPPRPGPRSPFHAGYPPRMVWAARSTRPAWPACGRGSSRRVQAGRVVEGPRQVAVKGRVTSCDAGWLPSCPPPPSLMKRFGHVRSIPSGRWPSWMQSQRRCAPPSRPCGGSSACSPASPPGRSRA